MASLYAETNLKIKESKLSRKSKRVLFYILMLALPIIQFCIFYIYVNFKSISMAFLEYPDFDFWGKNPSFVWFKNFKTVFGILKTYPSLLTNSLTLAFFSLFVGMPLAILFSFYIYKKRLFHGFYKVILFLPQIISGVVFALIVSNFFGALEHVVGDENLNPFASTLYSNNYVHAMLILFTIWMSFGVNVLLFTGAMNNINPSLVEAAELDGCNAIREFFHVTFPCVFPTIVSFVIITLSGIFINQMYLMEFREVAADMDNLTIGYFLFINANDTSNGYFYNGGSDRIFAYPVLSAFSLLITVVLLPVTLIVKKLLNKFGPNTR